MTAMNQPPSPRRPGMWILAIWATLVTLAFPALLIASIIDDFKRLEQGVDRDPFDFHFENALSGDRDFKRTVAGLHPEMNVIAACFWNMDRVENFLNDKARAALDQEGYFHTYDSADFVWRIVLISDDQRYKIVYLVQYFEPGEDSSQFGCHALKDFETVVTPPSLRNGRQELGQIRLIPPVKS